MEYAETTIHMSKSGIDQTFLSLLGAHVQIASLFQRMRPHVYNQTKITAHGVFFLLFCAAAHLVLQVKKKT